ncbi:hypothetical protein LJB99_06705 [Deltaproteobacteria bacterium OttesenSCG-928-K17]|nr:hypothetical protein [Deltaproteobacteria bacterium OttesenSCG-928-K17]
MSVTMLDMPGAVAEAFRLARLQVFASYGSSACAALAGKIAQQIEFHETITRLMPVESLQTALICSVGAQLAGQRAATFASSVDLEYLREACGVASGLRAPVVMPVFNRPLTEPWQQWCEHIDVMSARDSGWLQFYAADFQEMMDLLLVGFNLAERPDVRLPVMVCLNGFFAANDLEPVDLPGESSLNGFLRPVRQSDPDYDGGLFQAAPIDSDSAADEYTGIRYRQRLGFEAAGTFLPLVMNEYSRRTNHSLYPLEGYGMEGAQAVLVGMGSISRLVKMVVDALRAEGHAVGFLRLVSYRPFPAAELAEALGEVKNVGVLDHSVGLGGVAGPICTDVRAALATYGPARTRISSFLAGLGGRRAEAEAIVNMFQFLLSGGQAREPLWMDYQAPPSSSYIAGDYPEPIMRVQPGSQNS